LWYNPLKTGMQFLSSQKEGREISQMRFAWAKQRQQALSAIEGVKREKGNESEGKGLKE
jgi:hypothetical protein